jgi:hypothetical protein
MRVCECKCVGLFEGRGPEEPFYTIFLAQVVVIGLHFMVPTE